MNGDARPADRDGEPGALSPAVRRMLSDMGRPTGVSPDASARERLLEAFDRRGARPIPSLSERIRLGIVAAAVAAAAVLVVGLTPPSASTPEAAPSAAFGGRRVLVRDDPRLSLFAGVGASDVATADSFGPIDGP